MGQQEKALTRVHTFQGEGEEEMQIRGKSLSVLSACTGGFPNLRLPPQSPLSYLSRINHKQKIPLWNL